MKKITENPPAEWGESSLINQSVSSLFHSIWYLIPIFTVSAFYCALLLRHRVRISCTIFRLLHFSSVFLFCILSNFAPQFRCGWIYLTRKLRFVTKTLFFYVEYTVVEPNIANLQCRYQVEIWYFFGRSVEPTLVNVCPRLHFNTLACPIQIGYQTEKCHWILCISMLRSGSSAFFSVLVNAFDSSVRSEFYAWTNISVGGEKSNNFGIWLLLVVRLWF